MSDALIRAWHDYEMQEQRHDQRDDAKIVMGCPLWGEKYVRCFIDWCLPSILATANRRALEAARAEIVLYVDRPTHAALEYLPVMPVYVRLIPDDIMQALYANTGWKYVLLTAVHRLLIKQAADKGAGYSMMVSDIVYSERYFERLLDLGAKHDMLIQHALSAVEDTAMPVLARYRRPDGSLAVPADDLGQIGWDHLQPQARDWSMNGVEDFTHAPPAHLIHWRGPDSVRFHCPHVTPIWLSNARAMPTDMGGTIDSEPQRYGGTKFYAPGPADDMSMITLNRNVPPGGPNVDFATFKSGLLRMMQPDYAAYMTYFKAPCVVPTLAAMDGFLPDDVIEQRFQRLVQLLES